MNQKRRTEIEKEIFCQKENLKLAIKQIKEMKDCTSQRRQSFDQTGHCLVNELVARRRGIESTKKNIQFLQTYL